MSYKPSKLSLTVNLDYMVFFFQEILLLLLRIIYACLSGLPKEKLDMPRICNALVPYFMHEATMIQVSARNAAQFLIPNLDESKKQYFILSTKNVRDFVNASGKDMPVISSLKLFLAYGQFATNSKLFLREGLFDHLLSIMFNQSCRDDEKIMAVSVVKIMSLQYQEMEVEHGDPKPEVDVKTSATSSEVVAECDHPKPAELSAIDQEVVETIDLPHILCQLDDHAKSFAAACSQTVISHSRLKEGFDSFSLSLKSLKEKWTITSHDPIFYGILLSSNVSNTLLNVIIDLLECK